LIILEILSSCRTIDFGSSFAPNLKHPVNLESETANKRKDNQISEFTRTTAFRHKNQQSAEIETFSRNMG